METGDNVNNHERQWYTNSTSNAVHDGQGNLVITARRENPGNYQCWYGRCEYTSARLNTSGKFTQTYGSFEARIKMSRGQGMWPAFWMLGQSMRQGTPWPACGELDIMETVNGQLTGHGTTHCDVYPGGICNEGQGIGGSVALPNQDWHTWRMEWDRTGSGWGSESIRWSLDGQVFQTLTAGRIGNERVWNSLARSPFYFILNVAVGGTCEFFFFLCPLFSSSGRYPLTVCLMTTGPGYPNGNTLDGYGSMMEVAYVAHYVQGRSFKSFGDVGNNGTMWHNGTTTDYE
jgi:beta-glucanase (GH16 family)